MNVREMEPLLNEVVSHIDEVIAPEMMSQEDAVEFLEVLGSHIDVTVEAIKSDIENG